MTTTVTIKWQQQQQYNDNNNNTMTTTVTIKWQQQQQYNESIPIKEINGCKLLEKPMVINNAAFASKFETFYYSTLQQWQISSYIVQKDANESCHGYQTNSNPNLQNYPLKLITSLGAMFPGIAQWFHNQRVLKF